MCTVPGMLFLITWLTCCSVQMLHLAFLCIFKEAGIHEVWCKDAQRSSIQW